MLPTSKIKAIGLLVAVAALGFAAGAATMGRADTAAPIDWRERCSYSGMLKDHLQLTTQQQDSIRAIMRSHRAEMRGIMEPMRPKMDSVRSVVRMQIRAVLTPTQQARFESFGAAERAERSAREQGDTTGRAAPENR
jgi:Spy/CpxP family protein refolding chaperone